MRKLLLASAAFVVAGSGAAIASDSVSIEITATQEQSCVINSASSSIDLGTTVDVGQPGTFEYQCNFVGFPTLTFTSLNGGVETTANGGATADYGIYLNDVAPATPPSAWLKASDATGGVSFSDITQTTAEDTNVVTNFQVGLVEALPISGSYSDTLTIDIAP